MFTIIIPTYDHQDTVQYAIESVLNQTSQDFEIFVVGDGAPPRTKEVVNKMIQKDTRIRYFENPKGEGHGELHRANAIKEANGEFIAYLGDDDLWLPKHLETLLPYLKEYDFVQTTQPTLINRDDWIFHCGDLNDFKVRQNMLTKKYNFFGPTTVAHRLSAYLKLPYGWRPKPEGIWSDLHMWRQWLSQDWVSFKSLFTVTVLHLGSPHRKNMTIQERCEEMKYWLDKIYGDNFNAWLINKHLHNWNQKINNSIKSGSLIEIAQKCYKKDNYETTIELCQIILSSEPRRPGVHSLMINSLFKLDHFDEAEIAIKEALELFPNNLDFYNKYFNLAIYQNKLDIAEKTALEAIEIAPHKSQPYLLMSHLKQRKKDLAAAINFVEMAIEREVDYPHLVKRRENLLAMEQGIR